MAAENLNTCLRRTAFQVRIVPIMKFSPYQQKCDVFRQHPIVKSVRISPKPLHVFRAGIIGRDLAAIKPALGLGGRITVFRFWLLPPVSPQGTGTLKI